MKIKKNRLTNLQKQYQIHLHFTIMTLRNGMQNFKDMSKKEKIIRKCWVKIMKLHV
jgi:hypothetical protein